MTGLTDTQQLNPTNDSGASHQSVRVVLDVMGGDNAPQVVLAGARQVLQSSNADDTSINLILVGEAEAIAPLKEEFPQRVEAVPSTEVIEMNEHPAHAVRQKKDSSIVVGCNLIKEGKGDAFFSAGSTGGAMTAATLIIGRVRGVKRPAIATVIPAPKGLVVMLDAGANTDVEAEYILQFAAMGEIYAHEVLGVEKPRVGLLNVGEEGTKGSMLAQEAYTLLKENIKGFTGNAEGSDIFAGNFDVIATDGFTGNIVLKTMEGLVGGLFSEIKSIFYSSTKNKLAAAVIKKDLSALKDQLSAELIGGAPLLGLQAPVIIGHGSSSATAIANGIRASATATRQQIPQLIAAAITT
ncbi:MAG: phosphate acyltransferase PlsX [Coriobacteriia bacterium]|nr:phosphate acyltransferase PlsX [Coriobacteriia bacterium]MCL2750443.1 phosphate acyltransferase PlsX [Coriobacteriia bacterium]